MDTYLMMLYVSLEQEIALKKFFVDKGWKYRKPDLSHFTDEVGPIRSDLPVSDESTTPAPKITSARSKSAVATRSASSMCTRSKRKHHIVEEEETQEANNSLSVMDGVGDAELNEYIDDGDEDDDFVDDYTNQDIRMKSNANDDTLLAKTDGTTEDINSMSETQHEEGTQTVMIHPKDFVASLMNDLRKVNEIKSEVTADEQHRTSLSPLSSDTLSSANSVTNLQASMKYDCKECGKVYGKKCSLTRHMMSHKPGMVRCSACNWYFEDTEKLALHNEKFHSASYVCDECGSSMSRKSSLRKHMLRVHPDKCLARFTCTYSPCKAVFDSESLYNDHLNIHEGRKPHKCCQCEKAFASIISLKSHILNHSKDLKSSQCDVCGKVFQGNGALHNHRMSVHEQKRYKCELCQKEFMYRSGYCKHLLSHKKEKSKKKLGISNSGVKLRDLKILAGLGEKGVKLLTTGVVGKGSNLSVGLHSDTKTVNKDDENIANCLDSDTNSKEPSGLLQKSQNLNINETVVSFETASGTNQVADKTSTEVDCASTNLQGVRQAERVSPDGLIITTSDMDPNSQVTNIGEPVLSGTTSLQGVQLAHSGQIVWIYQN